MKFFGKLLLTWLLNLFVGSILLVTVFLLWDGNCNLFGSNFPSNISSYFESVVAYTLAAGLFSFALFFIIYLVQFYCDKNKRNSHNPILITYWLGVLVYLVFSFLYLSFFGLVFLIPYLLMGIILFRMILKIRLWSFAQNK